jgi:translation initiation factor IF-1
VARDDGIEMDGVVQAMPGGGFYKVTVTGSGGFQHDVTATLCGKMKEHKIRCVVGDKVKVMVSPYDLTKGRITHRVRNA